LGRWGFLLGGLLVGIIIGAAIGTGSQNPSGAGPASLTESAKASAPATTNPPSFAPPAIPEPDATYTSSCDYVLGDFTQSKNGFRFIAGADVENTGNIGVIVRVTATFKQLGTKPVVLKKNARIAYGESASVQLTKVVSQNQIDLIQSAQDSGDICKVVASVIDTFGQPQPG
jgi:hypothetical protein